MISVSAKTKDIDKMLEGLMKDMGPEGRKKMFATGSAIMFSDVIGHFQAEEDSSGSKWERWLKNGKRVSSRPTRRGGSKMLQDTGTLRGSIRPAYDDESARVFTDLEYAPVQNFGSAKKNIVPREFMYLSDAGFKKLLDLAKLYLETGL